jgi:hypothetical protein
VTNDRLPKRGEPGWLSGWIKPPGPDWLYDELRILLLLGGTAIILGLWWYFQSSWPSLLMLPLLIVFWALGEPYRDLHRQMDWWRRLEKLSLPCPSCGKFAEPIVDTRDRYRCEACKHQFASAPHNFR